MESVNIKSAFAIVCMDACIILENYCFHPEADKIITGLHSQNPKQLKINIFWTLLMNVVLVGTETVL